MERGYAAAPEDDLAVSGLAQMLIPGGQAARAVALMKPRLEKSRSARAYGGRSLLTLYGWALVELGDSTGGASALNEVLGWLQDRERAGQTSYQLYRERAAIHALMGNRAQAIAAMKTAFEQGWRLYGAWTLVDPMFRTISDDPAVTALVNDMRLDVRQKRERLGLAAQP
jgi:hypothetical protein